jgi:hypothetical protein
LFNVSSCLGASLSFLLTLHPGAKAQMLDFSIGPYHSTAIYNNPRGTAKTPLKDPELYHNTGFYIKAYEGSLLDNLIFSKSRFGFGEYFRLGAGLGIRYSPAFKHVKDDGSITTGFGGVYGTNELVAQGPVEKGRLGYLAEINYGLQFRYKFEPESDDSPLIGFRIYYALMMNPIYHNNNAGLGVDGYFLGGAKSLYYTQENFSTAIEWDFRRRKSNQTHDRFLSCNFKKINKEKSSYKGLRIDYVQNAKRDGAYAMHGLCFNLLFGYMIM